MEGSRIIYAGPSKSFTRIDNDQNRESNHAIYAVSCNDMLGGTCNTEVNGEFRLKSKSKVEISPLNGMNGLKDDNGNLDIVDEIYDCSLQLGQSFTFLLRYSLFDNSPDIFYRPYIGKLRALHFMVQSPVETVIDSCQCCSASVD